jgi:hypothetical protein
MQRRHNNADTDNNVTRLGDECEEIRSECRRGGDPWDREASSWESSSYVACTDKKERDLVRDHYLKKKLGLTLDDDELDQSVADACQKMHDDRDKPLAENFGKLPMFH